MRSELSPPLPEIQQNTLYLTTPGSYVARDHLTLQVEVPVYPDDQPLDQRTLETATGSRKVSTPIHHLESICVFGASTISPPALDLCWEHGVAVNYLNELGASPRSPNRRGRYQRHASSRPVSRG